MTLFARISSGLYKVSTGWVAVSCLVIFLLFTAFVLPVQTSSADLITEDVGSPDLSFFYTPDKLYEMAEAYGESGRSAYIRARFTFDLVWPLVYTLFLSTALSWIYNRAHLSDSWWSWVNLAPILGMIFDYLENISTSIVMFRYPASTNFIATLAPYFTAIKWIFIAGSFALLICGIIAAIWRSLRNHPGDKS